MTHDEESTIFNYLLEKKERELDEAGILEEARRAVQQKKENEAWKKELEEMGISYDDWLYLMGMWHDGIIDPTKE